MERKIIAEIRLAPGEVGYYDDYSRIYLSTTKPTAKIYAGTNTSQILKSIRSGRLRLVSGSLFKPVEAPVKKAAPAKPEVKEKAPEPEKAPVTENVAEEAPIVEKAQEEIVIAEPIVEEQAAEVKVETVTAALENEEEKPKRRRSRKKADAE